ncbi:hypothetical protein DF3PA_180001 [Candidatus Defluviicoccus seviourii]|uniref:Uncharacterized protein n=1 Tax=Candidatus Defluviicoccus seviourii TaxID=2565273 RepID=A0A564WCF4_9PROT|nr:hypothetical protein DF3PA_180001 [Candidatus Defluviicoccus seviourii]
MAVGDIQVGRTLFLPLIKDPWEQRENALRRRRASQRLRPSIGDVKRGSNGAGRLAAKPRPGTTPGCR